MRVAIRTDASSSIGTGHVMRCLTLAEHLSDHSEVMFVTSKLNGHLGHYIEQRGYTVAYINHPQENVDWMHDAAVTCTEIERHFGRADWVVVDHYGLDARWESIVKAIAPRILVIDDLADRPHACDILLDQNLPSPLHQRYDELVPSDCIKLFGLNHLLLRNEFFRVPRRPVDSPQSIHRILLFFGGADPTGETVKSIEGIRPLLVNEIQYDIVVGQTNPMRHKIEKMCSELEHVHYHCQVNDLARLMRDADFSIGAGGVTMWERCFLGLPSAVIVVADNQKHSAEAAAQLGAVINLGWHENIRPIDITRTIEHAIQSPRQMALLRDASIKLFASEGHSGNYPGLEVVHAMSRH